MSGRSWATGTTGRVARCWGGVGGGDEGLPGTGGFFGMAAVMTRTAGAAAERRHGNVSFQTGFPDTLVPCQPAQMTDTACLFLASSFS